MKTILTLKLINGDTIIAPVLAKSDRALSLLYPLKQIQMYLPGDNQSVIVIDKYIPWFSRMVDPLEPHIIFRSNIISYSLSDESVTQLYLNSIPFSI